MRDITLWKSDARVMLRKVCSRITSAQRSHHAHTIFTHLTSHIIWNTARAIVVYIPMEKECDIHALILLGLSTGKRILMPLPDGYPHTVIEVFNVYTKQYYLSSRGTITHIPVPMLRYLGTHCSKKYTISYLCHLPPSIILVPGLGFTTKGQRLGRGGGFYDTLLSYTSIYSHIHSVGVCFSSQICSGLPQEPHDQYVDYVLTEKGCHGT